MKRYGRLWEKVLTYENIKEAVRLSALGKKDKRSVQRFLSQSEENIKLVLEMLHDGKFTTSPYNTRTIFEPKKRLIYILPFYPDRIVQHAMMNIVEPIWDKLFDYHSYSCRKGRGIHTAMCYTNKLVNQFEYVAKNDISKFYPSMLHDKAMYFIERKIKDKHVLDIFDNVVRSIGGDRNIPIGNYMSQWIGNLYLSELDRLIREKLPAHTMVRYCDDFLLFSNNKKELNYSMSVVEDYVHNNLQMKFSKKDIFPTTQGVDFLGYRMFPGRKILLRKTTVLRVKRRMKSLIDDYYGGTIEWNANNMGKVASTIGWLQWCNSHNLCLAYDVYNLEKALKEEIKLRKLEKKNPFKTRNEIIDLSKGWKIYDV